MRLPYFWKPIRMTWSAAFAPAGRRESKAAPTRPPRTARLVFMRFSSKFAIGICGNGCAAALRLRRDPHRLTHDDRLGDESELVEAIGNGLLGLDDVVGDPADRKRSAIGGDGLDVERDAGDFSKRLRNRVA